jgi:hypothetical protein
MYLVELFAGREHLYESAEEFTAAIERGDIRPDSRIFHRTTSTWVPIVKHPEYRKVIAGQPEELPPLARRKWTFYGLEPRGRDIVESLDAADPSQSASATPRGSGGWRGLLRRALRFTAASKVTAVKS